MARAEKRESFEWTNNCHYSGWISRSRSGNLCDSMCTSLCATSNFSFCFLWSLEYCFKRCTIARLLSAVTACICIQLIVDRIMAKENSVHAPKQDYILEAICRRGRKHNRDFYSISRYETHGQFQKIKLKLISKIASSRDYKWFWLWGYSTRQIDIPGICEERNYKVS